MTRRLDVIIAKRAQVLFFFSFHFHEMSEVSTATQLAKLNNESMSIIDLLHPRSNYIPCVKA